MIQVALALPLGGLGLDTVHLMPDRMFWGRICWETYFGLTQCYSFNLCVLFVNPPTRLTCRCENCNEAITSWIRIFVHLKRIIITKHIYAGKYIRNQTNLKVIGLRNSTYMTLNKHVLERNSDRNLPTLCSGYTMGLKKEEWSFNQNHKPYTHKHTIKMIYFCRHSGRCFLQPYSSRNMLLCN